MKKSVLVLAVLAASVLVSAQEPMGQILNAKISACKDILPLNSYVQLAAGNEEELKTNAALKKQIDSFSATGQLISRQKLTEKQAGCATFAEGLLAGRMIYQVTSELAASVAKGLEKAAQSIK